MTKRGQESWVRQKKWLEAQGYLTDPYTLSQPHDPWPVTIFKARYQGVYEVGRWVAVGFNIDLNDDDGPHGSDIECLEWFSQHKKECGVGATPDEALADLSDRLIEIAKLTPFMGDSPAP